MRSKIDIRLCATSLLALSILLPACGKPDNAVSGTIEVDEVHVGPSLEDVFVTLSEEHAGEKRKAA